MKPVFTDCMSNRRDVVLIILGVKPRCQSHLPEVAQAERALGLGFGSCQRWQKHPCQDGDDGDDNQQFNEGESKPVQGWVLGRSHVLLGVV